MCILMALVLWDVGGNTIVGTMTLHRGYVGTEGLHIKAPCPKVPPGKPENGPNFYFCEVPLMVPTSNQVPQNIEYGIL